jgi:hypothetical protein
MNTETAQKMRTGAQIDDTPNPAPVPMYKRPVIQPATAAMDKTRSGATMETYADPIPGFAGQVPTGNMLWLWGIGAAIGVYFLFRPKPKRRSTKRR